MRTRQARGFTLIELLIVVAIIGLLAAIGIPGFIRARISANEAAAIGSLRAIATAQANFSTNCGYGAYSDSLAGLLMAPTPGGPGWISPDLATDPSEKSGYRITLTPGDPPVGLPAPCSAATLADSYAVTADPITPGTTGSRHFFVNGDGGTIYADSAAIAPVTVGPPASGAPLK